MPEEEVLMFFDTRIADFRVDKDVIEVGGKVRITGILQWYDPLPVVGGWKPLEYEPVELYINGAKVDETQSQEGGHFEFVRYFDREGEYTVQAHYPGSWKNKESWSKKIIVKVLSKEEYEQHVWQTYTPLIIGAAAGVVGLGILVYVVMKE